MDSIQPVQYAVDYFCDGEEIAHREPTQILPRQGDMVMFSNQGDTETAQTFIVEGLLIVIPEDDAEVAAVTINLLAE